MAEFIYTMKKVRKAHGDKVILDDVTLSFYPGAKIGVVGPNGAGKSSVLRIMAGLDKPNNGEAFLATDATVGILQQEPPLNEEKTVRGNVEEGLGEIKVKLDRFNEVAELMATDYSDELMEEMGRLQEELDHADAWDLDSQLEQAMDALRCPPPDDPVTNLSGGERRRVALCKLLLSSPTCCCWTSPPTTWTPKACSGSNSTWRPTRARCWRSPTTATSWTTSRNGFSNSTAAAPTPTRATIRPIWRRRPTAWRCRAARTPSCRSG